MTNDPSTLRALGKSGLKVTSICVGGSPLGSIPYLYGHETTADEAVATVLSALSSPFNFLDTANAYSGGESERRIGIALEEAGGLPEGFVLATKVDGDPESRDFGAGRVRISLEESSRRLGMTTFPLIYLHDPELFLSPEEALAPGGPVRELLALKEQGLVGAIGLAGGPVSQMSTYVDTGLFDVLLTHNRYTLLDRSARPLIEQAVELGMGVVNAAPFGGGVLAKGPSAIGRYAYGLGTAVQLDAAAQMQEACDRAGVPLAAAALQFSLRHDLIHSTIVGVSTPARLRGIEDLMTAAIPEALWDELETLVPASDHWIAD